MEVIDRHTSLDTFAMPTSPIHRFIFISESRGLQIAAVLSPIRCLHKQTLQDGAFAVPNILAEVNTRLRSRVQTGTFQLTAARRLCNDQTADERLAPRTCSQWTVRLSTVAMHRHAVAAAAVALTCFAIMASQASPPEGCLLPPETGMCEALFTRYAYDVKSGACVTFVYGGCGGNANNFESENQCINTCIGATTTPGLSSSSSSAD